MAKKNTSATLARVLYSAMFLALALLLPFLTSQIGSLGYSLCPMHLPVILCGFICGPAWGMAVGIASPLLRSFLFGYPELLPDAVALAVELAAFAFVAGVLYKRMEKNLFILFVDLITAMVCGKLVWGAVMFIFIFFGIAGGEISLSFLWSNGVVAYLPGIILQIILVPLIVNILKNNRLMLN